MPNASKIRIKIFLMYIYNRTITKRKEKETIEIRNFNTFWKIESMQISGKLTF